MMQRVLPRDRAHVASLLGGTVVALALAAAAPAQGEFVPVNALPPTEQLPAAPLLIAAYAFVWVAADGLRVDDLAAAEQGRGRDARARAAGREHGAVTAGHFIFIPAVLLVGIVIGWILGSRAARDAYAAELRRREERARKAGKAEGLEGRKGG